MYQKTLFKQNAKNVYEHLHKDSAQREINKIVRLQAHNNKLTSLRKDTGKKPNAKSDAIMGQRLVDEFLSGMQNLF